MCKVALTFSVVILGVLLTGAIVSLALNKNKSKSKNTNSVMTSMTSLNTSFNNNNNINYAFLNSNAAAMNVSKQGQTSYNPYLSSSKDGQVWNYGFFRGGDKLAGSGCAC